jgi:hypothetical protein
MIFLGQIDALSRPKHSALSGLYVARYSPQPRSYIKRIHAQRGPESQLADPMLLCMARGTQRNGVAIARFRSHTTIGPGTYMCSL